jgi:hypothetical protein
VWVVLVLSPPFHHSCFGPYTLNLFFNFTMYHSYYSCFLQAAPGPPQSLSPPFLAAMLCSCTSQGSAAAWGRGLGSVFKGFGAYKFTGGVTELETHMVALDRVTQDPIMLRQLVRVLCHICNCFCTLCWCGAAVNAAACSCCTYVLQAAGKSTSLCRPCHGVVMC